jgi:hypothetical protein
MAIEEHPAWADHYSIPQQLEDRAREEKREITIKAWRGLTYLQRFALIKLCRPGHESKNFIKAMNEFKIGS